MSPEKPKRDYRLLQLKHMEGCTFRLLRYKAPSAEWDHDHCQACWAKFAEYDHSNIQHEGYCISVPVLDSPDSEFIADVKKSGKVFIKSRVLAALPCIGSAVSVLKSIEMCLDSKSRRREPNRPLGNPQRFAP